MRSIKVKYEGYSSKHNLYEDEHLNSRELPEEMKAMARFVVAGNALDRDDYELLVDMLGISPNVNIESYERDSQGTSQTI